MHKARMTKMEEKLRFGAKITIKVADRRFGSEDIEWIHCTVQLEGNRDLEFPCLLV